MSEQQIADPGIIYPLTEVRGDDVKAGHYIRPENFRLPDLCDDCPLKEMSGCAQISRGKIEHFNIGPKNPRGVMDMAYMTNIAGMTTDVLLLRDASDSSIEPVVLEEMPVWNNIFSVEQEDIDSSSLGIVHERFDGCEGAVETGWLGRVLRRTELHCGTGAAAVSAYNARLARIPRGAKIIEDYSELTHEQNVVVDGGTKAKMALLIESAQARHDAGRTLKEPTTSLRDIETMQKLILSLHSTGNSLQTS